MRQNILTAEARGYVEGAHRACTGTDAEKMIFALARKLLIALWRYTTIGEIPQGIALSRVCGRWRKCIFQMMDGRRPFLRADFGDSSPGILDVVRGELVIPEP
jgi:hypothetical protein